MTRSERLNTSMRSLSRLASLTLVAFNVNNRFPKLIHNCADIVESVDRICLKDVQVEFRLAYIAEVGRCVFHPGPSLETCKRLEEGLLAIPNSRILVHDRALVHTRRGRVKFWSPFIKRAFPRMNERGLLRLPASTLSLIYCCGNH